MVLCQICKNDKGDAIFRRSSGKVSCKNCYRTMFWKREKFFCKRCNKLKFHQGKGLCPGCYNTTFRLEDTKSRYVAERFNLSYEEYLEKTKVCASCGFSKVVHLHHLDLNHKNNDPSNFAPLYPNCHTMIHNLQFYKEVRNNLEKAGLKLPEIITKNFFEKNENVDDTSGFNS